MLNKGLRYRCFPANFTKFLRVSTLQNTSGLCFYISLEFWLKKLSERFHYFKSLTANSVSKLFGCRTIAIIALLSKMSKFPQCHCQPYDLRSHFERSVCSVNDHPAILTYSKNSMKTARVSSLFLFVFLFVFYFFSFRGTVVRAFSVLMFMEHFKSFVIRFINKNLFLATAALMGLTFIISNTIVTFENASSQA